MWCVLRFKPNAPRLQCSGVCGRSFVIACRFYGSDWLRVTGLRVNRELERRAKRRRGQGRRGGGQGCGQSHRDLNSSRSERREESRSPQEQSNSSVSAPLSLSQPAWVSPLASLASSAPGLLVSVFNFTSPPLQHPPGAAELPLPGSRMMKFRFRRQGTDPQREKIKQELFAFNKVK